jgi:hypothetical protein
VAETCRRINKKEKLKVALKLYILVCMKISTGLREGWILFMQVFICLFKNHLTAMSVSETTQRRIVQ